MSRRRPHKQRRRITPIESELRLSPEEELTVIEMLHDRVSAGVPILMARDYARVRAVSDFMTLSSTDDGTVFRWWGYQVGGRGRVPLRLALEFGDPMTDDEFAAKVAELATGGESVYAIPC